MSVKKNFVEDVLNEDAAVSDIRNYICCWLNNGDARTLPEALGMTDEEFNRWAKVSSGDVIGEIIRSRKAAIELESLKSKPRFEKHTFFLKGEECKTLCDLLNKSQGSALTYADEKGCVNGFHSIVATRKIKTNDRTSARIEFSLWHSTRNGFYLNVAVVAGDTVVTSGCIKDINIERLVLCHDNISLNIGISEPPPFEEVGKMFNAGEKVSGCEINEDNVFVMLDWPSKLSASDVVIRWFSQQNMLCIYGLDQLWASCNGEVWERVTFDIRMDGTMVTVYRA